MPFREILIKAAKNLIFFDLSDIGQDSPDIGHFLPGSLRLSSTIRNLPKHSRALSAFLAKFITEPGNEAWILLYSVKGCM